MALSGEHLRARPNVRAFAFASPIYLQLLAVAAATFWLAYDHGGFQLESRNPFAIGVWWAVLLGVGVAVFPLVRPPVEAVAFAGFLAAFACWTLASAAWAPSGESVLFAFDLAALYLGIFVLTLVASRRASVRRWTDGLALGIVVVAALAIASRLRPGLIPGSNDLATALPSARSRLSYPIGYWNGLAALAALGVPLLLRIALAGRSAVARSLAVAGIPLLAVTIYLTSSRGGAAAALLAVIVFLALTNRRWETLGTLMIAGVGSLLAVLVFVDRSYLTNGGTGSVANSEGRSAALLLLVILAGTGAAFALALMHSARFPLPPAWMGRALVVVVALGLVGAVAASHPIRRFDHFRALPVTSKVETTSHLYNSAGSGRWQFWSAAVDEFVHHPLIGGGAGSYGRWWDRHGSFAYTTQNAHSLYLETLGELGIVGFLLLLGILAAAAVGIARRIKRRDERDLLVPALTGAFAAYVLLAGIDWMWQLPAVTGVAFVLLGLLVGPAVGQTMRPRVVQDSVREPATPPRRRLTLRVAALALGWLVVCAQALPLFAQLKISDSQAASRSEDVSSALTAARAARALEPWAASPYLQLALVQEQAGDVRAALASIGRAIHRDHTDWRLWLVDARLQMKAGRPDEARASVARIRTLHPRSPLLAPLYRFLSP
jgi:hypothetical protein